MKGSLVVPTKAGTLDAFSFNRVHGDSKFLLSPSPCSPPADNKKIVVINFNTPFAIGVFSYCYYSAGNSGDEEFGINVYELKKFLELSTGSKGVNVEKELLQMSKFFGVTDDGDIYKLVEVTLKSQNYIRIKSVYFKKLIEYMCRFDDFGRGSFYTSLIHTKAVKCRSKAAFEVMKELCSLIARRGTSYGGVSHVSLEYLLKSCPQFGYSFVKAKGTKRNEVLKNTLSKSLEYLKDNSYIYKDYSSVIIELPSDINRFKLDEVIEIRIGVKKYGESIKNFQKRYIGYED